MKWVLLIIDWVEPKVNGLNLGSRLGHNLMGLI